jgi:hypothetical protein
MLYEKLKFNIDGWTKQWLRMKNWTLHDMGAELKLMANKIKINADGWKTDN